MTPGGYIVGRVTDRKGAPMPDVNVGSYGPATPSSSAMILMAITNRNGEYRLHVPEGHSVVYITNLGPTYHMQQIELDVAKGQTKTANFTTDTE